MCLPTDKRKWRTQVRNRKVKGGLSGHGRVNSRTAVLRRLAGSNLPRDNCAGGDKSAAGIKHQMVVPMQEGTMDRVTVAVSEDYCLSLTSQEYPHK